MKKFAFLSFWILSIVSCVPPEDPPSGFGELEGYTYLQNENNPIQGLGIRVSGNMLAFTDVNGYFGFAKIAEGNHSLEVLYQLNPIYSTNVDVYSDKITTVKIILQQVKKNLPDFSVVDISDESPWDYWVVGKEEYFYIDEENSLPKSVFYHSFKNGKDYGITFDSKGLPSKVITDHFIFLFDNFNGNKVDLGIISPSGEIQVVREIQTDFIWPTSPKSPQSKADIIRWTGGILGAIPCVTTGAAAFVTGGFAIPLALWTCGNYFVSMANNFFDDANVENGFTRFVEKYHLVSTVYICGANPDPASCLLSLAFKGLDAYADYVEEMEYREADLRRLEELLNSNVPLKEITIQPGPEGKDAWVRMSGWPDCSETYSHSGNDSLLTIMYDDFGNCIKEVNKAFLQFYLGSIPLNAIVISAKLEVYGYATIHTGIPTLSMNKLKGSWDEGGVTWQNQPESELISKVDFIKEGEPSWYSWDVTSAVQDFINSGNNFGFGIFASKNGMHAAVCSSDHSYASRRPKLIVSYY